MRFKPLGLVLFILFIACSQSPAAMVTVIGTTKHHTNNDAINTLNPDNSLHYSNISFADYSENEVLSESLDDKILMNFYPENYFAEIKLPGQTYFQVSPNSDERNSGISPNPIIAEINGIKIDAVKFADRMFQRHRNWFEYFLKELLVATSAKIEGSKEGIFFAPRYIRDANQRVIKLLRVRAQNEGKYFSKIWAEQGFETEKAYIEAWELQTARMLLLEHLIFLMFFRTDKVEYSHIILSDQEDKFSPDPLGRAKDLANRLRQGKISWNQAVQQYSQDHRTVSENGKVGTLLKETSGQPMLEEFLFSNEEGAISEPLQSIYGYQIVLINKRIPGKPDATYRELLQDIENELNRVYKTHIPGLRITTQDTFDWLEKLLRKRQISISTYYPARPEKKPYIAIVQDMEISAGEFFVHTFMSKPDWARQVMSEILIFEIAKIEAEKEKVILSEKRIEQAVKAVLDYLAKQTKDDDEFEVEIETAGKTQKELEIWEQLNYPTKEEFYNTVKMLTIEALQVERVILLHDYRLDRVKLYHILCISEEIAFEVRAQIFVSRDFEGVARRFSKHKRTRERGGLIGIVPKGTFSESFERIAFNLKINEISKPFQTEQGWHILKVTEKYPAKQDATYSTLKSQIEHNLEKRGSVPGKRITTADMLRWVSKLIHTKKYNIKTYIPNIDKFTPEAPSATEKNSEHPETIE